MRIAHEDDVRFGHVPQIMYLVLSIHPQVREDLVHRETRVRGRGERVDSTRGCRAKISVSTAPVNPVAPTTLALITIDPPA